MKAGATKKGRKIEEIKKERNKEERKDILPLPVSFSINFPLIGMSDIHRRLDNQIKKTNQRENVSSIDDRNQENLNKSEYLGEDLNEEDRTEEDRTERVNCNPFDKGNC